MKAGTAFLMGFVHVAVVLNLVSAQAPALAGTWKLNVTKSHYSPRPAPRSESITYERSTSGFIYRVTASDVDGSPTNLTGALSLDGQAMPATGSPDYDTVATRRIDAYTSETIRKKSGRVVQTVRRELSTDGKTLTLTTTGSNARGDSIHNVGVYERQ